MGLFQPGFAALFTLAVCASAVGLYVTDAILSAVAAVACTNKTLRRYLNEVSTAVIGADRKDNKVLFFIGLPMVFGWIGAASEFVAARWHKNGGPAHVRTNAMYLSIALTSASLAAKYVKMFALRNSSYSEEEAKICSSFESEDKRRPDSELLLAG